MSFRCDVCQKAQPPHTKLTIRSNGHARPRSRKMCPGCVTAEDAATKAADDAETLDTFGKKFGAHGDFWGRKPETVSNG